MSPVRGTHSLERGGSWCSESEEGWKDEEEGVSHLHQIVSVVAMQWTIVNKAEDVKGSGEVSCSTRQGRWEETRTRQLRLLTKAARH